MIAADRSDSKSEIHRGQDVYDQFINKAFILKVIRNLYAIPPSPFVSSFSPCHFLISVPLSPFPPFLRVTYYISL